MIMGNLYLGEKLREKHIAHTCIKEHNFAFQNHNFESKIMLRAQFGTENRAPSAKSLRGLLLQPHVASV